MRPLPLWAPLYFPSLCSSCSPRSAASPTLGPCSAAPWRGVRFWILESYLRSPVSPSGWSSLDPSPQPQPWLLAVCSSTTHIGHLAPCYSLRCSWLPGISGPPFCQSLGDSSHPPPPASLSAKVYPGSGHILLQISCCDVPRGSEAEDMSLPLGWRRIRNFLPEDLEPEHNMGSWG